MRWQWQDVSETIAKHGRNRAEDSYLGWREGEHPDDQWPTLRCVFAGTLVLGMVAAWVILRRCQSAMFSTRSRLSASDILWIGAIAGAVVAVRGYGETASNIVQLLLGIVAPLAALVWVATVAKRQ